MKSKQTIHEVKQFKVSDLHKHPNNPRTLKDSAYNTLKQSIEANPELLEARPLILSNRTGKNIVIGGNQRLQVVKDLGWLHVPCVLFPDMSEEKEREIMIRDNVSNGDWDWDKLANEWNSAELNYWGLEVPDWEQEQEEYEGQTDQDAAPELEPEAVTRLGDLWLLGDHRLLCGDSTDPATVEILMNGQKADMVFTDPPYGVEYQSNMRVKSKKFEQIENDDLFLDIAPIIEKFSQGWVFVWTSWKVLTTWINLFSSFNYPSNIVIWHKPGGGIGDLKKTFLSDYEAALVWHRGAELCGKRIGSVWTINKDGASSYVHPTQKPVALAEEAIDKTTKSNNSVLDLFLGSGSTLIACEKTKRKCYGMELSPQYCDVIIKRWQDFSGKQATLEATGETFEEVKHGRAS